MQAVGFTVLTCRAVTYREDLAARSWTALLPCQRQLSIHRIPTPHLNRPKCRSRPQVRDRYSETAKSGWLTTQSVANQSLSSIPCYQGNKQGNYKTGPFAAPATLKSADALGTFDAIP